MKRRRYEPGRLALSALALAAACAAVGPAHALSLGRISVQSVLGEALRAEIEVASIDEDEALSLVLRVASPRVYSASGREYHPVLVDTVVTLERERGGRHYLQVRSERAVVEPFVELVLEANWAGGRLVREYTLLIDPPRLRAGSASIEAQPVVEPLSPAPGAAAAATPTTAARPTAPPAGEAAPARAGSMGSRPVRPAASGAAAATAVRPSASSSRALTVQRGDTLLRLARQAGPPPGVSLDQWLVALYRGNPQAFVGENMNRLQAGAVLSVPSPDDAASTPVEQARQVVVAHSEDFFAYRQRLASGVTAVEPSESPRRAAGTVQAEVLDRQRTEAVTPDRLQLSRPSARASGVEAAAARDGERRDVDARIAELQRNIDELRRLQQGAASVGSSAAARPGAAVPAPEPPRLPPPAGASVASVPAAGSPSAGPVVAPPAVAPPTPPLGASPVAPAASAPAAPAASAPAAAGAASAPAPGSASAPAGAAASVAAAGPPPASAPAAATASAAAPSPPAASPGVGLGLERWSAIVLDNLLPAVALLLVLWGWLRWRRRRGERSGDTSFVDSRLEHDSWLSDEFPPGLDGRDSAAAPPSAVSTGYSMSQLDAIGDVDPVAEADVYLAYGRDLQAEEILKEAIRAHPERLAIRTKLLEVYAKRRDVKGYEVFAGELHALCGGQGVEWERAQALGREIDPDNPLYQPGGEPEAPAARPSEAAHAYPPTMPLAAPRPEPDSAAASGPDAAAAALPAAAPGVAAPPADSPRFMATAPMPPPPPPPAEPAADEAALDLDFRIVDMPPPVEISRPVPLVPPPRPAAGGVAAEPAPPVAPMPAAAAAAAPAPRPAGLAEGALDFDVSMPPEDLPPAPASPATPAAPSADAVPDADRLDFDLSTFDLPQSSPAPAPPAAAQPAAPRPSTPPTPSMPVPSAAPSAVPSVAPTRSAAAPSPSPAGGAGRPARLQDLASLDLPSLDLPALDLAEPSGSASKPSGPDRSAASRPPSTPSSQDAPALDLPSLDLPALELPELASPAPVVPPPERPSPALQGLAVPSLDAPVLELQDLSEQAPDLQLPLADDGALPVGLVVEASEGAGPLQLKLELAEEFRQIGDLDGARDLLEEVVVRADGPLRARAQAMLAALSSPGPGGSSSRS